MDDLVAEKELNLKKPESVKYIKLQQKPLSEKKN